MNRRLTLTVALTATAVLALTGCSDKTTETPSATATSGGGATAAADLAIVPLVQIDTEGAEVPASSSGDVADPAGDGTAKCDPVTIAVAGAFTGANAALGLNIQYGAKVAVDAHNAANKDCQVTLKPFDTEGDPQKATQVAPSIVADENVIGLLGPAFSGETNATGSIFNQAGLLSLTASATNPDLTANGWDNFFRGLANDAVQGPSVAKYLVGTAGFKSVCVIQDDSDYGIGLAEEITAGLGDAATCTGSVKTGDKDFSATVEAVKSAAPDAIFYAGYYAEAAPLASQLRDGGVTAVFVSADGTNDPQFVTQAGAAASGALLSCPCGPAPDDFEAKYTEVNGQAPGVYSTEGYDLATIILKGIDSGITERKALVDFVAAYQGQGLARTYEWDDTGELASALIWVYEVKSS